MSYKDIPGYSGFLPLYDEAVDNAADGDIIVEVGVALGHSIAYLARKVIDSGKRIRIVAVDPWEGVAQNGEQQAMAKAAGGDFALFMTQMILHASDELNIIDILHTTSSNAAKQFEVGALACVLIDAAHDYASVLHDIRAWAPLVSPTGVLAGDDHEPNYPGVQRACEEYFGAGGYEVRGTTWVKDYNSKKGPL